MNIQASMGLPNKNPRLYFLKSNFFLQFITIMSWVLE